jgi:L-ascorbate metabolism protein UlaG (beta-lactamase superfamily)
MAIINELYSPTYALIPIGGRFTMGPREAAYAMCKFLTSVQVVIPMHYQTFPLIPGSPEEFISELELMRKDHAGANLNLKTVIPFEFRDEEKELNYHH